MPCLSVNTWSHEEEPHVRCHEHQVGHAARGGQLPRWIRRFTLRDSTAVQRGPAPTRVRLRISRFLGSFDTSS